MRTQNTTSGEQGAMQKLPLDYATRPGTELVPSSPFWIIARLVIAAPFALCGFALVFLGISLLLDGEPDTVGIILTFLTGALPIGIAVAAFQLPVRRRRAYRPHNPPLQRTGDEGTL